MLPAASVSGKSGGGSVRLTFWGDPAKSQPFRAHALYDLLLAYFRIRLPYGSAVLYGEVCLWQGLLLTALLPGSSHLKSPSAIGTVVALFSTAKHSLIIFPSGTHVAADA